MKLNLTTDIEKLEETVIKINEAITDLIQKTPKINMNASNGWLSFDSFNYIMNQISNYQLLYNPQYGLKIINQTRYAQDLLSKDTIVIEYYIQMLSEENYQKLEIKIRK
jgi:hypothetical protein